MESLPTEIVYHIMSFIRHDCIDFLKYLKENHNEKYKILILSINKKINNKYEIFGALEYAFHNIHNINTKEEYMEIKKILYFNVYNFQTNIIVYKLLEFYISNIDEKRKKKFMNLCANNFNNSIYNPNNLRYEPKLKLRDIDIYLKNYLHIKKELLSF